MTKRDRVSLLLLLLGFILALIGTQGLSVQDVLASLSR